MSLRTVIIFCILISSFLSSQNARQNKLDQEHWIKHFTFIGPFSDESSANNILTDVLEGVIPEHNSTINNQPISVKSVTSNSMYGFHFVHQLYRGLDEGQIIIGVANVFSEKKQSVVIDIVEYLSNVELYNNGKKVELEKNNNKLSRTMVEKGPNTFVLKIINIKKAGFALNLYQESRIEIIGKCLDSEGNPVPSTDIRLTNLNGFQKDVSTDGEGNFEILISKDYNKNDQFYLFADGRKERFNVTKIDNAFPGMTKSLKIILKERQKNFG